MTTEIQESIEKVQRVARQVELQELKVWACQRLIVTSGDLMEYLNRRLKELE